ncbi:MAG TPA: c-type cytochrome [Kofleriaceae bacterium]|jgi:cytochrome c
MRTLIALSLLAACGSSTPAPATPTPTPIAPDAAPPPAPDAAPDETASLLAQSALSEQYLAGAAVYTKYACDTCHESHGEGNPKNPALIGAAALPEKAPKISKLRKKLTFTTAADVVAFVRKNMPIDKPGSIAESDAYAVVAWMLDESKVTLAAPLDATTAPKQALH